MADTQKANPWLIGAGIGANALGAILGSRANGQANQRIDQAQQRLYQLADDEQRRRNMLVQGIMPQLGNSLHMPELAKLGQSYGQSNGGSTASTFQGVPSIQGSKIGSTMGTIGGITGGIAGSAFGPLGTAVGSAIGGATNKFFGDQFGKGRRTANTATQNGGYEQQFDQAMAEAVRRRDAGDVEGAKQVLQQGYNTFQQGSGAYQAKGGNYATVANQAINQNPEKWQTYESIKKSLGMA